MPKPPKVTPPVDGTKKRFEEYCNDRGVSPGDAEVAILTACYEESLHEIDGKNQWGEVLRRSQRQALRDAGIITSGDGKTCTVDWSRVKHYLSLREKLEKDIPTPSHGDDAE